MDYVLTTVLMIIGVAFHVMSKISGLRKRFPELSPQIIWNTFFKEEWDSLIVSAIALVLAEIILYAVTINGVKFDLWFDMWGMYLLSLLWGYAGQRLAYKVLSTGEGVLEKKVNDLKNI